MVDATIPITRLRSGQAAYVDRIDGRADHVHRLEEFGLRGGTKIEMFREGNPCIIRMAGNKICLRSDVESPFSCWGRGAEPALSRYGECSQLRVPRHRDGRCGRS